MNNLTQKQKDTKADYLQRQLEETIKTYQAASRGERRSAIRHIDSFIETLSEDGQTFWLKFRERLERMNERPTMDIDTFNTIYLGGNSTPFLR
jgi:hypothetical protein